MHFNTINLIKKIAFNFESKKDIEMKTIVTGENTPKKNIIIITDGLVAVNIFNIFTNDIFKNNIFCPTSLETIAKNVLGEQVKVSHFNFYSQADL